MSLRITQNILYQNSLTYLQRGLKRLDAAQIPVLTGKKINRPSDDPFNAVRVLKFRQEKESLHNYLSNISELSPLQESSASTLLSMSSVITEARVAALQGASSGQSQADRDTLADEIDHIIKEMVSLANTHFGGRYLFSGSDIKNPPYHYNGTDQVTYSGNSEVMYVGIAPGSQLASNIPGEEIFNRTDRGVTYYGGSTGAAMGTGADSGTGNDTLQVRHGTTTYAAGSGVSAGTGSAAGDTILGPLGAHTLTLDTGAGTVALDGGAPVVYNPASTNFQVSNENGDSVFLDLTGALATGTWDITSTGTLSTDGGATTTAINFSASQAIYDSASGSLTHVNSSNIVRTGDEYLTYDGTFDAFEVLVAIRDDLRNTRGLDDENQIQSLTMRLDELDKVHQDVLSAMSEFGGRARRLEMADTRLTEFNINLSSLIADIEETDITEAVSALQQASTGLELAQAVAAQIMQTALKGGF